MERVLERNILAVFKLLEEIHLADAIKDSTSKDLGLVKSLQLRMENIPFERDHERLALKTSRFSEYPVGPNLAAPGF